MNDSHLAAEPLSSPARSESAGPILAAVLSLAALTALFTLLAFLMEQRPQFIGQGLHAAQHVLEQSSPTLVLRKKRDDYAVHTRVHPDRAVVRFHMERREEDRGLRKVRTMGGTMRAEYSLANPHPEPVFVLFSYPRPRDVAGLATDLQVTGISVESEVEGVRFDTAEAWLWSGELAAGERQSFTVQYGIPAVTALRYHVGRASVDPIEELDVAVAFDELPPMAFTSAEGARLPEENQVRWQRSDFLPPEVFEARIVAGQSLFGSLQRLLQIGPFTAGLFLVAVVSYLLSRRPLGALQVFTLGAAYGIYFPLVLYLSVTLSFPLALGLSVLVPGFLISSQARTLVGGKTAWFGALALLAVYQVFPTLAAFSGWNRGLVLLCVGVVTLFVVVDLQNKHLRSAAALVFVGCLLVPSPHAATRDSRTDPHQVLVGIADYRVSLRDSFLDVEASLPVEVLGAGASSLPLSDAPLLLTDVDAPDAVRLVRLGKGLGVQGREVGSGRLTLRHRVPLAVKGERLTAAVPLVHAPAARIVLDSSRADLVFEGAQLWSTEVVGERFFYELGGAGGGSLVLSTRVASAEGEQGAESAGPATLAPMDDMYGIGITTADYLTVLSSDGSAILFAAYELAGDAPRLFELEMPAEARLLSALVDGVEVGAPRVEGQQLVLPIEAARGPRATRRVALRLDLGRRELGFLGTLSLALPTVTQTAGRLRWAVAFPESFGARVHASGLDSARGSADLSVFGEYGRIVSDHTLIELQKSLAPARSVTCSLQYYQRIRGVTDKLGR